jgi:pimeloyl-ACP methyl ester carboxylesterase
MTSETASGRDGMSASTAVHSGLLPVHGMQMYYESRGEGGVPLVVVHGGFGLTTVFGDVLDRLAVDRRVVAIDLQGHGRTADVDRPFTWDGFADDVAAVVGELDLGQADLLGYSLGGNACLRAAIRHPERVRRLVVVAAPCRREAWYPELRTGMDGIADSYAQLRASPLYTAYAAVAPDVDGFAALVAKTGALMRTPYDWSDEVRALPMPVMLVYGDADGVSPAHAAEFFELLGGGRRDGGWDRSGLTPHRLAVLPATTHYEIGADPRLAEAVLPFLE